MLYNNFPTRPVRLQPRSRPGRDSVKSTHVTGRLGRSRRQKIFLSPKKIAERFFLASTVRVCLITQDDRDVENYFYRQKKSQSDFCWRRPLGCVLKETYAEGGKNDWLRALINKRSAEGGIFFFSGGGGSNH